jgi:tetratricopeptide (TPR) repeat protein
MNERLTDRYRIIQATKHLSKNEIKNDIKMALNLAKRMEEANKKQKAVRIYKHLLALDGENTEVLNAYAEHMEKYDNDIINADTLYNRVLNLEPDNSKANTNKERSYQIVAELDKEMMSQLDSRLEYFYEIPTHSAALQRAKKEAYFLHIYHSNAIEGNTLNLIQTRHIVEDRLAIAGKSLLEHQEVLGLDSALRYINSTLLYRDSIDVNDLLELHRRVLGFTDPIESGKFRKHQVKINLN